MFVIRQGSPETVELPWSKVQCRIAQLIKEDRFFTQQELDNFEDIDTAAVREQLESGESSAFDETARASTLNAHFTSPTVIKAIYEAVGTMGFEHGNILEPACGVGNFFGLLPESMAASKLYGVELDSITGRIARQLYPKAHITIAGFETVNRKDFYDIAAGNVPFGDYKVNDPAYSKYGFSIHNYFLCKALDQLRPGGVLAFVTSRFTMDARRDPGPREHPVRLGCGTRRRKF